MGFTLDAFARLRPFLYHLTAQQNLDRIRRLGVLEPAATIVAAAGRPDLLTQRRREHEVVVVDGQEIVIRDQAPLHRGNMRLDPGWDYERFIAHLNERVFLWPGTADGPISYGLRHFARYEPENPAILRVPTKDLIAANPGKPPLFCRYNSGSPRWTQGIASPRGHSTFIAAEAAAFRTSQVVEVTFSTTIQLPDTTQVGDGPQGPWDSLR